jgi:hypothetical protein
MNPRRTPQRVGLRQSLNQPANLALDRRPPNSSRFIYRDLASLFRRSCPGGLVVYLAQRPDENIPEADILLSDEDEPRSIVKRIRAMQREKAS